MTSSSQQCFHNSLEAVTHRQNELDCVVHIWPLTYVVSIVNAVKYAPFSLLQPGTIFSYRTALRDIDGEQKYVALGKPNLKLNSDPKDAVFIVDAVPLTQSEFQVLLEGSNITASTPPVRLDSRGTIVPAYHHQATQVLLKSARQFEAPTASERVNQALKKAKKEMEEQEKEKTDEEAIALDAIPKDTPDALAKQIVDVWPLAPAGLPYTLRFLYSVYRVSLKNAFDIDDSGSEESVAHVVHFLQDAFAGVPLNEEEFQLEGVRAYRDRSVKISLMGKGIRASNIIDFGMDTSKCTLTVGTKSGFTYTQSFSISIPTEQLLVEED